MVNGENQSISQEALGLSTNSESQHGLEVGSMSKYKAVFEYIIPQVEAVIYEPAKQISDVIGQHDGTKYSVRFPHLRKGKHAFVAIVDLIPSDGENISVVIRNVVEDALNYLELSSTNPLINTLVPELYGISGEWVVMECLQGLELEELEAHLGDDPDFLSRYVRSSLDLVLSVSKAGLQLNDVTFMYGHNVMVDPDSAKIRLIEQRTVAPTILTPNEVITRQLFDELDHVHDRAQEWRIDYAMKLVQAAVEKIGEKNLFIKSRLIKPTNPGYRDAYFLENWKKLSDAEYEKILANQVTRDGLTVVWSGRGITEAFTDAVLNAAISGDKEKFDAAISGRRYKRDNTDKTDPRFGSLILPD